MERSVGSIVTKIDSVLAKLETMEMGRSKRKQAMSKILGAITEDEGGSKWIFQTFLTIFVVTICLSVVTLVDSATKRKQMEELVRKELDHWDDSRPSTQESNKSK